MLRARMDAWNSERGGKQLGFSGGGNAVGHGLNWVESYVDRVLGLS